MIIVQIIGGLGNQMFQYAFGKRLAEGLGVPLKLDVSGFRTYQKRRYGLGQLSVATAFASDAEIEMAREGHWPRGRRLLRRAFPSVPAESSHVVRERTWFVFDPEMLSLPDGTYLEGYWQSEKYFAPIASRLRGEFVVRAPLAGRDAELADAMGGGESVSLHVRRGDYVTDPVSAAMHNVCDEAYYRRCVDHLAGQLRNPHFFVFSDEPEWARKCLPLPFATTIVDHNGEAQDALDLRLMSLCRHHVIANSSFSWWGAWLDPRPDKIVLMPTQWLRDRRPEMTPDIRPQGWEAL